MTIYEEVKAIGGYIANHESDLYIEVNDQNVEILSRHPLQQANARRFCNAVTGKLCFDIPFSYDPWWSARLCSCPGTAFDAQGEPNDSTCELTEEQHNSFKTTEQPFVLVHYIHRWSGNPDDERPFCGANSPNRTLSGVRHDSTGTPLNICPTCAEMARRMSSVYIPDTTA